MGTSKNKYITGFRKFIFFQYLKLFIGTRYTIHLLTGKVGFKQCFTFFRRALLFLEKVKSNKVVKTRGVYKLHLYFPAFPTKAFFIALDKFLTINQNKTNISPTCVLLSITKACSYNCKHCYQKNDILHDIPISKLKNLISKLQELKISFINIEGGEPLIRFDRLCEILKSIDDRSEIWVNSTGYSLNKVKAEKMKELGVFGVMISIHHWDKDQHDTFVGRKGAFDTAISALELFKEVGISTAINCTGSQDLIRESGFEKIMDIAKKTGCSMVQLIHEKPAGAWLKRKGSLNKKYLRKLYNYHIMYNKYKMFKDYPSVSSQVFEESEKNFGCTAGGIERFYINANGDVQPCEFVNLSFGNINEEDFLVIYKRMRNVFDKPRTKWCCSTLNEKIKKHLLSLNSIKTPLPKEVTEKIIKDINLGKETKLYHKMKLYK
jgi:MoaA/NifB/PqqE/SkfB family radical SAM enzyme